MNNRKYRRICAVILTLMLMTAAVASPVYAAKTLDDVNSELKESKEKLSEGKKKAQDLVAQIETLNEQIATIESEVDELDTQIAAKQDDVDAAQEKLDATRKDLDAQNDALNQRVRAMYKNGDTSVLEILIGSKDISEFLSNVDMLQMIYDNDQDVLDEIKEQYNVLKAQKDEIQKLQNELKVQQSQKKDKQSEMATQVSNLEAAQKKVASDNEALEAQIDKLNKEASDLTRQLQQQQGSSQVSSSSSSSYSGGVMLWPVPDSHRITSQFGVRFHPILKRYKSHSGLDIGAPTGTKILAASSGKVIYSAVRGGYGNCVMVDHGGGIVTLYGHCSKLLVTSGQSVNRGDNIALVGSTGQSTGPHCHFEVRVNGTPTDPLKYLQ